MNDADPAAQPPAPQPLEDDGDGTWARHWQHPRWLAEADDWVTAALADAGVGVTGSGVTYKIRFWSVVRCYPTTAGLHWFKENNPGQSFEARLVAALAALVPDFVVRPVAIQGDRGWLLTAHQGSTLGDNGGIRDQATRLRLVTELAALQRAAAAHAAELADTGLTDVGPSRAGGIIRDRLQRLTGLPFDHPLRPDAVLADRLRRGADRLDQLATQLHPAIPMSLDHNDLHAHNVFGNAESGPAQRTLRFFDFGDSVWGHPFSALHSLVNSLHWTADLPADDPLTHALIETYLSHWTDLADQDTLHHDYRLAASFQPVTRMVSWCRLLDHADLTEIAARLESPRYWMNEVAALGD